MKSLRNMSQAELAAFVQTHLRKQGLEVTLSGGAAVSIYTVNQYISGDIDLVENSYVDRRKLEQAMAEIGFHEKNRYFFHRDSAHIIEFPSGPLSVGEEPVKSIKQLKFATGTLRVISPTDCVKDRLAGYFFWNDHQSLIQAILVAVHNRISLSEIKRWSIAQGKNKEFEAFFQQYQTKKQHRKR